MKPNVKITAANKEFKDGTNGYEVHIDGMDGRLACKMNFRDPLKAIRYMHMLSRRLDLQIDNIQLCALSLAYKRAKEAVEQVVDDAVAAAEMTEDGSKPEVSKETTDEKKPDETDTTELTPIMKQFYDLKAKHPDALLIFRCGDFYETYNDDATVAAEILGITLTNREGKLNKMAGFPNHALDIYLPKLIRAGKRVAICDQLGDVTMKRRTKKMQDMFNDESAA